MTRRRGSIQYRAKKYEARLYLHGRRLWLGRHWTEHQAQRAIDEVLAEAPTPQEVQEIAVQIRRKAPPSVETVEHFANRWVNHYPRRRDTTNQTNHYAAKRIAELDIRHFRMRDVTRPIAREFALKHPYLLPACRAMFNDALDDEIVEVNPFAKLRLPTSRGRADLVPLTPDEVGQLATIADRYGFGALVLVAAYTGMRTGELFELRWEDIDFKTGTIRIRRRMKSERGQTIILADLPREALQSLERPVEGGYVFRTKRGHQLTSSNFAWSWHVIRDAFEMQLPAKRAQQLREARLDNGPLQLYELRHAYASHMLDRGAKPMDVAMQLGHRGTELLEQLYGHPDQQLAQERLRRAMGENVAELREASNG